MIAVNRNLSLKLKGENLHTVKGEGSGKGMGEGHTEHIWLPQLRLSFLSLSYGKCSFGGVWLNVSDQILLNLIPG